MQHGESEQRTEVEISEELRKSAPMISALYEVLTTLQLPTDGSQSTSLNKVRKYVVESCVLLHYSYRLECVMCIQAPVFKCS